MKILAILLILIMPFLSFCQEKYTYRGNGKIFENEKKITLSDIEKSFGANPEIINLYKTAKTKQITGNIFLATGFALIAGKLVFGKKYSSSGTPPFQEENKPNNILYYVGGALILISLPISIGYEKKFKAATSLMNEDLKNPKTSFNIESTSFIANSNGVGISITF